MQRWQHLYWRIKRKRPARQRQVPPGENQPDLSRKIYPACYRFYFKSNGDTDVARSDPAAVKKARKKTVKWVITIFLITIVVSGVISFLSDTFMGGSSIGVAFLILLLIILIGIVFDIIGMAVASADEKPFHSMASRKVPGAQEAIRLLRNAERVSSICNDVVGDICGVISGSASATIAVQVISDLDFTWLRIITLVMSSLAAGLTVGGKALGKTFAVNSCVEIVHSVGKLIYMLRHFPKSFRKKKK